MIKYLSLSHSSYTVTVTLKDKKKRARLCCLRARLCCLRGQRLLSIVSKLCERCILDNLIPNLLVLLSPKQHGFVPRKFCVTQLLKVLHDPGKTLDSGQGSDVLYFDFSKAFDSVYSNLRPNRVRTFLFHDSFFNRIVPLWNIISLDIRETKALSNFKDRLFNYFLNKFIANFDTSRIQTWKTVCPHCRSINRMNCC